MQYFSYWITRSYVRISPVYRNLTEIIELEVSVPLLVDVPRRWVMFPLQYPRVYGLYNKHMASFWTAEEIVLSQDTKD